MGEQDEAGRAEALPPPLVLPPPPDVVLLDFLLPPQPAATSARITATAASAPTNSRLFTLPPPSRNGRAERALDPHRGRKYPTTLRLIATPNRLYDRKVVNLLPLDHRLWPWLADTMAGAEVAELVDAPDSKSGGLRAVWVRFPPSASPPDHRITLRCGSGSSPAATARG